MSQYHAPLRDMAFVIHELLGLAPIQALPGQEELSADVVNAILEEANRFASGVLAPLNGVGDRVGCRRSDSGVTLPPGFKGAYTQFCDNGWNAMPAPKAFGGEGLPQLVNAAVWEMWNSANLAFALCPTLTGGAIEAVLHHATPALQALYLPHLVSGRWSGTMNLTEPQAGSDLAAIRARAVPTEDGRYRVFGTKIFITWGEHDAAENIVHLVLARLPDAPPGVKGISLFLVPKFLLKDDGTPGERNDVVCAALEHKLGIHGSPTCVMAFGEQEGALGWLVGQPHQGLACMFSMMNHARFGVGLQGLAMGERAYQRALAYARDRVQGTPLGFPDRGDIPILHHPDVQRLLTDMKARNEAMRALVLWQAWHMDLAHGHSDPARRRECQAWVDFFTPVVKGWCTETGVQLASQGIQVHGGMGFIEETGAAQYLRDARITSIYEGTTAIQANDLIGRKLARDKGPEGELGVTAKAFYREASETARILANSDDEYLEPIGQHLEAALNAFREAADWLIQQYDREPRQAAVGAAAFLELTGITAAGWLMARAALLARERVLAKAADSFYRGKVSTAQYFAAHHLVRVPGLRDAVLHGAEAALALEDILY